MKNLKILCIFSFLIQGSHAIIVKDYQLQKHNKPVLIYGDDHQTFNNDQELTWKSTILNAIEEERKSSNVHLFVEKPAGLGIFKYNPLCRFDIPEEMKNKHNVSYKNIDIRFHAGNALFQLKDSSNEIKNPFKIMPRINYVVDNRKYPYGDVTFGHINDEYNHYYDHLKLWLGQKLEEEDTYTPLGNCIHDLHKAFAYYQQFLEKNNIDEEDTVLKTSCRWYASHEVHNIDQLYSLLYTAFNPLMNLNICRRIEKDMLPVFLLAGYFHTDDVTYLLRHDFDYASPNACPQYACQLI